MHSGVWVWGAAARGRPPAHSMPRPEGNYCCGDAREDKNKAQYGGTFSRLGVGVEGGGAPRASRQRLQRGINKAVGAETCRVTRTGARGVGYWGVRVGDSLKSRQMIPHCCLKMPHRKGRFGVGIQGSLRDALWSAYGRGITSGQKSRIAKDKEARVGIDIWILGVDKGEGKSRPLLDLHSLTASPG